MTDTERRALEIWRKREKQFPRFVQRMHPDDLDMATGAWARVVALAEAETPPLPPQPTEEALANECRAQPRPVETTGKAGAATVRGSKAVADILWSWD